MTVSRTNKVLRKRILYVKDRNEKMRRSELKGRRLLVLLMLIGIVLLLCLSLAGCTKSSSGYVKSDSAIPDLSPLARQPERSSICLPTCTKRANETTMTRQQKLTSITTPDSPVKSSTTP